MELSKLIGGVIRLVNGIEDDDFLVLRDASFLTTVKFSFCDSVLLLNDKVPVPNKLQWK